MLCYFYLRPSIEYYSSGPVADSKSATEDYIRELAPALGFSTDSLAMITMRKQHQNYVKTLQDTLPGDISLSMLNEGGVHIQSWQTVIGQQNKSNGVFATPGQLFEEVGALKVNTSNAGRVIRMEAHPENSNLTFLTGDSLLTIAQNLVGYTFGYNLNQYMLSESVPQDDSTFVIFEERNQRVMLDNSDMEESLDITWKRKEGVTDTPAELSLSLKPIIREIDNEDGFRTEFGYSIASFKAMDIFEPADLDSQPISQTEEDYTFTFGFFLAVFVLAILIFSVGIRNIFKGKVEWRRALLMFLAIAAGSYGWRAIFFMDS